MFLWWSINNFGYKYKFCILLWGGDIKALADDCTSVLFEAAGGHSLDCKALLLKYGGSGNMLGEAGLLPIHWVACGEVLPVNMSLDFTFSLRKSVAQGHIKDGSSKLANILFIYLSTSEVPVWD